MFRNHADDLHPGIRPRHNIGTDTDERLRRSEADADIEILRERDRKNGLELVELNADRVRPLQHTDGCAVPKNLKKVKIRGIERLRDSPR